MCEATWSSLNGILSHNVTVVLIVVYHVSNYLCCVQPIPYWLYKLHGLNISYTCEICGNYTYRGPKVFQRHFAVCVLLSFPVWLCVAECWCKPSSTSDLSPHEQWHTEALCVATWGMRLACGKNSLQNSCWLVTARCLWLSPSCVPASVSVIHMNADSCLQLSSSCVVSLYCLLVIIISQCVSNSVQSSSSSS